MVNNKVIIIFLIITILLSVVSMVVALGLNVKEKPKQLNSENIADVKYANVGLTINPTAKNGGKT